MMVLLLVAGLQILFKNKLDKDLGNLLKKMIGILPLVYTFVSYASIYLSKFEYINNLFSGRFVLYEIYTDLVGLNWFGSSFIEENAMLDNSYLHMFLSKGVIFSIAYLIFIYILITKTKHLSTCDGIILFGYFTAALAETVLFKFDLIILMIIILYKKNNVVGVVSGEY